MWRKPSISLPIKNLTPTVKHDGGHLMIWGARILKEFAKWKDDILSDES